MSKVAISGNASGTGTFTIQAPNSNTDRVLSLPDEAGTVLTSASSIPAANLTGSLPNGVGGMKLLSSQTASSDTYIIFDNTVITSDYKNYRLIANKVVPASDSVNTRIWMSVDNGLNFNVSTIGGRQYNQLGGSGVGHESTSGGGGEMDINQQIGSAAQEFVSYIIDFGGLTTSGHYKTMMYRSVGLNLNGNKYTWAGSSMFLSTSAVNYIRCGFNSGAVASGQFFLYGVDS
jgi:hypothetical protein